ncbi:DUF397 domain-containing protein [Actinophytocola glycyrrhizae]|uniref:DUF397 domain-containing protein n=1 Tax=Actinophytocola glycyrrhizae TaxID=2044873 RepID=A0ABV9S7M6_9PSEU
MPDSPRRDASGHGTADHPPLATGTNGVLPGHEKQENRAHAAGWGPLVVRMGRPVQELSTNSRSARLMLNIQRRRIFSVPPYGEVATNHSVIHRCESSHPGDRRWRRASACIPANECVEVGRAPEVVMVRDSKAGASSPLSFDPFAWDVFLDQLRAD